jgi:molybdopterin-containing oxidoreductase family membrane subunit
MADKPHPDHDLIQGEWTEKTLVEKLLEPVEKPPPRPWRVVLAVGGLLTLVWLYAIFVTFVRGLGTWGINQPVAWGFDIVHFVWWIGIGHAGTLISAILVLMRQNWRDSLNRVTEAMTLFAVLAAATYPLIHMGRPQNFYWVMPYPTHMALWPQYKSPLSWDVLAIMTYLTISTLFLYLGLIPDLALLRERSQGWRRKLYGWLSLGWTGNAVHWQRYRAVYVLLAGLATPVVISVHSVVSMDFAYGLVPGWHLTVFPPLLRRRGHLFGLRHGPHPHHPLAEVVPPRGGHHREAPGLDGQGDPGQRPRGGLHLPPGDLHRLVLRESLMSGASSFGA